MSGHNLAGKRVAIYARFSSLNQRETSLEDQVRRCTEYVRTNGGKAEPDLIFLDAAVSGASLQRPGFEKMVTLIEAAPRGIDAIVTEDMSRISRDFADAASVFKRLQYMGIPLIGVGDGIDTSARHAKMAFTLKSLMSDMYLDDLRDKTLRGLEGRALAGFSTGGLPLGYRSVPVTDAYGQITGHRIEIDAQSATVVGRVFALYLDGRSLESIAHQFNADDVPPPRAKTRHRRKGWVSSTVRAMLHNEAYIGVGTFNRRQWLKVPGTNIRRPRKKDEREVIRRVYEDRRVIDEVTWNRVQERLQAVRATYVKSADTQSSRRGLPGRQNHYVLSGLLRCGACGAPMSIQAGTSARYYRCSAHARTFAGSSREVAYCFTPNRPAFTSPRAGSTCWPS
jgi:site-specific DNA recombinase